ncbi:hypothetical protein CEXT_204971 [Caerostris extrusa]|uniref:Uncharacterized protein n=1 Tax=Caerostris extrusa TaxID=172846 RepID=A0AAV4NE91_CAEEX|nr:hypothetical protein CEXT_204971 [Caerostris extrusa]
MGLRQAQVQTQGQERQEKWLDILNDLQFGKLRADCLFDLMNRCPVRGWCAYGCQCHAMSVNVFMELKKVSHEMGVRWSLANQHAPSESLPLYPKKMTLLQVSNSLYDKYTKSRTGKKFRIFCRQCCNNE